MIGSKPAAKSVPILAWVFFAVFLLATLVTAIMTAVLPAIVFGILALSTLGFILFTLFGDNNAKEVSGNKRFGKGPYTRTDSSVQKEMVQSLESVLSDLRKAAVEENWDVDLTLFDKCVNEAAAATSSGKLDAAVRCYARGMTDLMDQVRGS